MLEVKSSVIHGLIFTHRPQAVGQTSAKATLSLHFKLLEYYSTTIITVAIVVLVIINK